jgi:hypothetical protein
MRIRCITEKDSFDGQRYYKAGEVRIIDVPSKKDLPPWAIPLREHAQKAAEELEREDALTGPPTTSDRVPGRVTGSGAG